MGEQPQLKAAMDSFLEELVVRRELTDNFCFHNEHYDQVEGASEWARKTLEDHAGTSVSTSTVSRNWRLRGRTMSCGMPRRRSWSSRGRCTGSCGCTGLKRSWSGQRRLSRPLRSPFS